MNNWRLLQEHRRVSNIPNGPENIPLNRRIRPFSDLWRLAFSDLWRLARDKDRTRPQTSGSRPPSQSLFRQCHYVNGGHGGS